MIVHFFNQDINLSVPSNADKFLAYFHTRENAETCAWGKEFDFAERVVSRAYYDECHK